MYVNFNCVFLDCNTIRIGDRCLFGPNVQVTFPTDSINDSTVERSEVHPAKDISTATHMLCRLISVAKSSSAHTTPDMGLLCSSTADASRVTVLQLYTAGHPLEPHVRNGTKGAQHTCLNSADCSLRSGRNHDPLLTYEICTSRALQHGAFDPPVCQVEELVQGIARRHEASSRDRLVCKTYHSVCTGPEFAYPITIGNDCWFGGAAIVISPKKGGITIGDGVVVGAGAVVTRVGTFPALCPFTSLCMHCWVS